MPEIFDGEKWETMAEGARRIGVEYHVLTNYVHYKSALDSRTVGPLRYLKSTELDAKADEIREHARTRKTRQRRVAA